jgi:Ca2+-binding EF-hand superfamily protein
MLDSNGSGSLSYSEFAEGIERSKVPWKDITGLPQLKDVFKLFDVDGDHEVSLVEFLGFPDADDPVQFKGPVPTATMWKRYVNNVKLSPMNMCRQPKWTMQPPLEYRMDIEHHHADLEVIKEKARQPDDEVRQFKRVMSNQVEEDARRVEIKIRDLGQLNDAMKSCKNTIQEVYNSERGKPMKPGERSAEQKLERARGAFGNFALGGPRLRPVELPRGADQGISHFKKPPDDELLGYFSEKYITDSERELRDVSRRHDIPLVDAGKIHGFFQKYDEDGSGAIEREEFRNVVSDMLCVGKAKNCELADSVVDQFFVTADKRRCGEVSFEDFLTWAYFNGIFRLPGQ